jgi:hypothetical protein
MAASTSDDVTIIHEYVALASEQQNLYLQYQESTATIRSRMKTLRPMVKSFLTMNQVTSIPFVPPDTHRHVFGDHGGLLTFQSPSKKDAYAPWTDTQIKEGLHELFHLLCEENDCHELDEQAQALCVGEQPDAPPLSSSRQVTSSVGTCHSCPSLTRFIKLLQQQEDTWFVSMAYSILQKHRVPAKHSAPTLRCKKRKVVG